MGIPKIHAKTAGYGNDAHEYGLVIIVGSICMYTIYSGQKLATVDPLMSSSHRVNTRICNTRRYFVRVGISPRNIPEGGESHSRPHLKSSVRGQQISRGKYSYAPCASE